jgi:FkbH-like protein
MVELRKEINVLVVSDMMANFIFGSKKTLNNINFIFEHADLDNFEQSILSGLNYDYVIMHISPFAFNYTLGSSEISDRVKNIFNILSSTAVSTNCKFVVNTIALLREAVTQEQIISNHRLEVVINDEILNFCKDNNQSAVLCDLKTYFNRVGHDRLRLKSYDLLRNPYSRRDCQDMSQRYLEIIDSDLSARKKVIFVDADNTLWGGVVGEDGVEGVSIGSDSKGASYTRFQVLLKDLKNNGIILCLLTKNNLSDIEDLFNARQMHLKIDDFVVIKANWSPKSGNLMDALKELNLDVTSAIFIDDNPFEIEEVSRHASGVTCIQFTPDLMETGIDWLVDRNSLYRRVTTAEDNQKTDAYIQERKRKAIETSVTNIDEYIKSLEIKVTAHENNSDLIPRISQLTQKTNQFNLTTKRYSPADIANIMSANKVYSFSVSDKFGEMGVVGVVIVIDNRIDTFLLSCRAFGRKIEDIMLTHIKNEINQGTIIAEYRETRKNIITKNFYPSQGFKLIKENSNHNLYEYK